MSRPGQFSDFNKAANDLLNKVFPKTIGENTWGFEYDLKPTSNIKSKAKVVNKGGDACGEISSDVVVDDLGFTLNSSFKTAKPSLTAAVRIDRMQDAIKGLTAKLHFDADGGEKSAQTAGVSLKYARSNLNLNARVYVPLTKSFLSFVEEGALEDQDTRLEVDFVHSNPNIQVLDKFFLGGLAKLSFATSQPGAERTMEEGQLKLGYRDGDYKGSLRYKQNNKDGKDCKSVGLSVFTQPGETSYVADVDYDLASKNAVLTLGAQYLLNDGATLKTKIDTNKQVGLSYVNRFARGTELSFGTLLSVDNSGDAVALGSSFSFNLKFNQ